MEIKRNKTALVCGAGGFIGSHLVARLKDEGYRVCGVDQKYPEFNHSPADEFILGDLRDPQVCQKALSNLPYEVYQLAADMGGAGYVFTGHNDADIMHNSGLINLNMAHYASQAGVGKFFYSSSACIYPEYNQSDPQNPLCSEESAYPALPDSEYGWEKLFSERLFFSYQRNYGLRVKIARLHNIFGPEGTWTGGREKAPAALCRKVVQASNPGTIDMWGDGRQTRSFLYISECIEGIRRLMDSETFHGPVNIGSTEMVTIDQLAEMIIRISGKDITVRHIAGPQGVRGRNSDNRLIKEALKWEPQQPLTEGLKTTYAWIEKMVSKG